jgi:peptidoglycan-N-acetylglucosamine deacetylase
MRRVLVGLVATAYVAAAWSLFVEPLPVWLLAALALAYAVVITLSVCLLELGTFLDVELAVPSSRARVALSFDDGPHPVHTRRILDALDAHGAKASFFVIGEKAARHPDLLREIAERGHELALHSWSHDRHLYLRDPAGIARELERSIEVVELATGRRPTLFRPPIGFSTPRTRAAVRLLGLRVAGWSVRAFDGVASASSRAVAERVARRLEPGAIVLLHDAAERGDREPASVEALPAILAAISERGLRCVTVSELTNAPDEVCSSGVATARAAAI